MSRGQVSCYQSDTSQEQGKAQQRPPVLTEQTHQRKTRRTHDFTLHLFPSGPLEWSQMKGRCCSGSSNCLKISSWHEFKNSVWNVNALENSSFPAGVLPHKTRKPLKSRAEFREAFGTHHVHIGQTHRIRPGPALGAGNLKAPLVPLAWLFLCSLNNISLIFPLWFCRAGSSQCAFRISGHKNLIWWWLWELGGLLNGNMNVSVGLGPVGLRIKIDVKHAAVKTL